MRHAIGGAPTSAVAFPITPLEGTIVGNMATSTPINSQMRGDQSIVSSENSPVTAAFE